jgi:hypothetical protein
MAAVASGGSRVEAAVAAATAEDLEVVAVVARAEMRPQQWLWARGKMRVVFEVGL